MFKNRVLMKFYCVRKQRDNDAKKMSQAKEIQFFARNMHVFRMVNSEENRAIRTFARGDCVA
jgi:hypothetical protein